MKRYSLSMEDGIPHMDERPTGEYVRYREAQQTIELFLRTITVMGPDIHAPPQFWDAATALRGALAIDTDQERKP